MNVAIRKTAAGLAATSVAAVLTLHDVLLAQHGFRFDGWRLAAFAMSPYIVLLLLQRFTSERSLVVSLSAALGAHFLLKCLTGDSNSDAFSRLIFGPLWLAAVAIPLAQLLWRERQLPHERLSAPQRRRRLRQWSLFLLIAPVVVSVTPIANGPWSGELSLILTAAGLLGAIVCAIASFGSEARRLALRYGNVLWYAGLALAAFAAMESWNGAAKQRSSLESRLSLNESTRSEMRKILLRYPNNREAEESVANHERQSLEEDRRHRAELGEAIKAERSALVLSSPIVILFLLSIFRLRNGRQTADGGDEPAPLPRDLAIGTPQLLGVAGVVILTSLLVIARGVLFYGSGIHGITASGVLALITGLVAVALLRVMRQRPARLKAMVVGGALAVMVFATAARGVENFWAANATHEIARLATEFRVRKSVTARSYSFGQYGSYAPVLRFLHDFFGATGELLHDIDGRMGAITLAPGGFSSVDDIVRAQAAFKRFRTEAAGIQNDINATIERFAARAPAYGMSASNEASVVNGMRGVIRSDGGNLVRDIAPICDAGDRLFDFLLAHRDEVVFDREGHFLLLDEQDAEKLDMLTDDLQAAARQTASTYNARQRHVQADVASVVPSLEGYRDW